MEKTIDEQLASLRSTLRRQRLFNLALVGVAVAAATVAAVRPAGDATFDTVTCNAWKLIDKDGKNRILAGTLANGSSAVYWYDKDGKTRIGASTMADGSASITLCDKNGTARIGAATSVEGGAAMSFLDKDGKTRISAGTTANGNAAMSFLDKDEKIRILAGTKPDGAIELPTTDLK